MTSDIKIDQPLRAGNAISGDSLSRGPFAQSVIRVLQRVSDNSGLVVSVEGSWGSGKTSLLAIVEEKLNDEPESERPIIVHFNPWLVGERDALLRQFLGGIEKAIRLANHVKNGKRVAKELKSYSKAFDLLKIIPGAEPWASLVKTLMESLGDATESIAEHKTPDLEERKDSLKKALEVYPRRIVVFIDDVDRLFPAEVFEMVRIVKAVGDLPNVGYVLAWDSMYVSSALEKLSVPFASAYIDKVVQVRLPIPPLSLSMRTDLMNKFLAQLSPDALKSYFSKSEERLSMLFFHGLSELMETPRDVVRLLDVVKVIEPGMRSEINLADIIGLACLMTKASEVYQLLQKTPQAFVGKRPGASILFEKEEDVVNEYANEREHALEKCGNKRAVKELVHWLFPLVPEEKNGASGNSAVFNEGHIAHPNRLLIALQLSMLPDDVSLVRVQQFIMRPNKRLEIAQGLREENCVEFLLSLKSMVGDWRGDVTLDVQDLSIAIARLIDADAFVKRRRHRGSVWETRSDIYALKAVEELVCCGSDELAKSVAEKIITDPFALSVAALLALRSFSGSDSNENSPLKIADESKSVTLNVFIENIINAIKNGSFFEKLHPHIILFAAWKLMPEKCGLLFEEAMHFDPTGDKFVEVHLQGIVDSTNGQRYSLPKDLNQLEAFVSLESLKKLAGERLRDENLKYPVKAAWRAVVEGGEIYGRDGSVLANSYD